MCVGVFVCVCGWVGACLWVSVCVGIFVSVCVRVPMFVTVFYVGALACVLVCVFVRHNDSLGSHWTDFHEILILYF